MVEHIHIHSHLAGMVEHRLVGVWHRGFAAIVEHKDSVEVECHKDSVVERRRDFVENHILSMDLLHWRVVPVLHKDFAEYYELDRVLTHHLGVALALRCQVAPDLELDPKP